MDVSYLWQCYEVLPVTTMLSIDCDDLISIYKIDTGHFTFRGKNGHRMTLFPRCLHSMNLHSTKIRSLYKDSCHCKPYCAAELKNVC